MPTALAGDVFHGVLLGCFWSEEEMFVIRKAITCENRCIVTTPRETRLIVFDSR